MYVNTSSGRDRKFPLKIRLPRGFRPTVKSAENSFSLPICVKRAVYIENNRELPKRKKNRLENYDYSLQGVYFLTICTQNRRCNLSRIVGTGVLDCPSVTGGLPRFGHARGLTPRRGVIQDPRAASLPRLSENRIDKIRGNCR